MNRLIDFPSQQGLRRLVTAAIGSLIGCGGSVPTHPVPSQNPADRPSLSSPTVPSIPEPYRIEITGHEYQWRIRYPGADGQLDTNDDRSTLRHLHVPQDIDVVLSLTSEDYLYTFALPDLGVKEIAVPDLEFQVALSAAQPGRYELRGDQLCGFAHPQLLGDFIVQPPDEFLRWLRSQPAVASHRKPSGRN